VSERRACRVVGQHRSVQRHQGSEDEAEGRLVSEMRGVGDAGCRRCGITRGGIRGLAIAASRFFCERRAGG